MIGDQLVNFVPQGSPLSLVLAAGAAAASNVYDIMGAGVGVAPPNIIGNRTLFGADMGIGTEMLKVESVVGTAFVTADAATLNVQFQGAADTGVGGGYQPGAWTTLVETGYMPVADLTAQAVIGRFDFPPAIPVSFQPRFLRMNYQTLAATQFSAGTIAFCIVTMGRDDYSAKYGAPRNYAVA